MANLNNWESIDVQQIIDNQKGQDAGRLCKTGGLDAISMLAWTCALPEVGTAGFGISNFPAPDGSDGFTPGWCTMVISSDIQLVSSLTTFAARRPASAQRIRRRQRVRV
jgi:hypothetical protein